MRRYPNFFPDIINFKSIYHNVKNLTHKVGKTTLMVKYVENKFDEDYIQTLGEPLLFYYPISIYYM